MSRRRAARPALAACLLSLLGGALAAQGRKPVVLNDDAGWCWFQDERALVVGDRLVFGSDYGLEAVGLLPGRELRDRLMRRGLTPWGLVHQCCGVSRALWSRRC
jgi:hypothetical protein